MKGGDSIIIALIEAAVVVPVYRNAMGEMRLILVRRSAGGVHGGQLAFPGGKWDKADASLLETAIRETQEEIGLVVSPQNVLAPLPEVTTKTTGFRVSPFLCRISPPQKWTVSEREIAEVIDVALADLGKQSLLTVKMATIVGGQKEDQPYYAVGQHKIWGVTYRILQPLLARLLAEEWFL